MPPQNTDERDGKPSASTMDRRENCPGSEPAERGLPPLKEESYTVEGTDIHAAMESGDLSKLTGDSLQTAEKLTELQKDAVRIWHEERKLDPEKTSIAREERLWVHNRKTLDPLVSAKLDIRYVNEDDGLIIDYKTGFLDAPPAYVNAQLRTQAVCLWHEFPNLKNIRVAIAHARFKPTFDFCDYSATDLQAAENLIITSLWRGAQPNAPRFAGTWCRYCRAQANCREAASFALLPVAIVPVKPPFKDVAELVSALSIQDLALINSRKSVAEKIFEEVNKRLKSLTPEELAKVGLMLKPNSPSRDIPDVKALYAILKEMGFADGDEFMAWCSISIGAMEDTVVDRIAATNKITKKDAKVLFGSIIEPAVKWEPRSPTLKRLSEL